MKTPLNQLKAEQKRLHDATRPFTYVETEDDFDQFVVELEARTKHENKEVAIDLEHHSSAPSKDSLA